MEKDLRLNEEEQKNVIINNTPELIGTSYCSKELAMELIKENIKYSKYVYTNPNIDREVYQCILDESLSIFKEDSEKYQYLDELCSNVKDTEFTKNILAEMLVFLRKNDSGDYDDNMTDCFSSLVRNSNVSEAILDVVVSNYKNKVEDDYYSCFLASGFRSLHHNSNLSAKYISFIYDEEEDKTNVEFLRHLLRNKNTPDDVLDDITAYIKAVINEEESNWFIDDILCYYVLYGHIDEEIQNLFIRLQATNDKFKWLVDEKKLDIMRGYI